MQIASWNVNGIRACAKKGFFDWLSQTSPDIVCLQETRAEPTQLGEQELHPAGYLSYWQSAEKKGYSGVALYSKHEPTAVRTLGHPEFDSEGRVLFLEFDSLVVGSAYFPNSQDGGKRLEYKLKFCDAIMTELGSMVASGKDVILAGDYNIAHQPIDIARPAENENSAGYLPEERAWMSSFLSSGYIDTFRQFDTSPGRYTWWSYRGGARTRNVGWRIDYHCVNERLSSRLESVQIQAEVHGSDHCPILLNVKT
ncbi:MAG: exodeoxyribonuclease III [Spirochaetaceae bacterium]|nr:MAG: exodeoxyribonuclease III [Spirochaetaceae bacterium]